MDETTVRALGDEDWQVYRDIRIKALKESPDAFAASAQQEEQKDEEFWHKRMSRSRRLVAEQDGAVVGVVSVKTLDPDETKRDDKAAELFGLYVVPELRGKGISWKLVQAATDQARSDEHAHIVYWVGTDNGRAVAFASSFGFRPTDARRPMRSQDASDDEDDDNLEMAMVFPLSQDPHNVPSSRV